MKLIEQLQNQKPTYSQQLSQDALQLIPGIWVNGKYFWLQNSMEKVLNEEELIIKVKQEHPHSKIRYSSIYISNHGKESKEVKILAMHYHPIVIHDQLAFVSPTDSMIFHLANKNIYLVNGACNGMGMKEYTAMPQWNAFTDQIWSSLPKGTLNYHPMAKGPAASIFSMKMKIGPHEIGKMSTWTITGSNKNELLSLEHALMKQTESLS
ncbi:hypothetical protein [Neobacillus drentensis]|uniref:hypothetical protein n=1 Tax=Neobacillus drentensis TaxID=220684 RepID=UPI002FFD6AA5